MDSGHCLALWLYAIKQKEVDDSQPKKKTPQTKVRVEADDRPGHGAKINLYRLIKNVYHIEL